jgi:hypothetical protein
MSKIQDFAAYVTTAQKSTFTGLDGNSRLNVVNNFYNEKGLEKPAAIVVTTQKRGSYLSKDEKLSIQSAYIAALKSGKVDEEIESNFEAVNDPAKVATFSRSLPYSEAVKEFGPAIVAAKMIDGMPVTFNEEFHKIRQFEAPAAIAVSEIPAFIKALQAIFDEATKPEK